MMNKTVRTGSGCQQLLIGKHPECFLEIYLNFDSNKLEISRFRILTIALHFSLQSNDKASRGLWNIYWYFEHLMATFQHCRVQHWYIYLKALYCIIDIYEACFRVVIGTSKDFTQRSKLICHFRDLCHPNCLSVRIFTDKHPNFTSTYFVQMSKYPSVS